MSKWLIVICSILLLTAGCQSTENQPASPMAEYTIENDTLLVSLTGYKESCTLPTIFVMAEDGSWQPALNAQTLPDIGLLYLNDEYTGYMACDFIVCDPIQEPYRIRLEDYALVGERSAPDNQTTAVPEYRTNVLKGTLKVELDYFADDACQEPLFYSAIIENN